MAPPTPNLPDPKSYEQYLSDMLSSYASKLGINDFNVGSVNTSFFEVVALAVARASGDLFQILRDFSVDRASGDALQRLALEYGVQPASARLTTGSVNISDTSFSKISTTIYAGTNPPNIGSTEINVGNASDFPASGNLYIGRGTPNVEGPIPYATPPVQTGTYWTITLSGPTAKFHNLSESVILAQGGNRTIPANNIVLSKGVGTSVDIQYSTITSAIILDGETSVSGVQVAALIPGADSNVPAGTVNTFASPPFSGAAVTNPLPFTNGADSETDEQLRIRVKNALASNGLGTATAVKASVIGATATENNGVVDTIVSDSLVQNTNGTVTLYVDNGKGYEETTAGVGLESIVDSALGGEQFFQLQTGGRQAPVAKAFLETTVSAPYDIIGGDTLAVVVGEITYQHVFDNADFISPGNATAYEVTASINGDSAIGYEAITANNGEFVIIRAKAESNDSLFVTTPTTDGRDAAVLLGFPANISETLRLYKNDIPLTKDGETASVFSQAQELWSPTIANGETLILSIDGTAPITFTILDADFIATGLFANVSPTNSLASWIEVFNNKLTGVTASIVGNQVELTSNLGPSDRAEIIIDPSSTLVLKGMFSQAIGLSSVGKASDFTLDRNTAQFELTVPLEEGDKLSAGSANTEATIESAQITSGSITFSADAYIWILIDTEGELIPTGVIANTTLSVSKPSSNVVRYTSNVPNAFGNVATGDYIIVWSEELSAPNRLEGRVNAVTATTVDILVIPAEFAAAVVESVNFQEGFVILRSALAPQKFKITSGLKTLDQVVQELQPQTENLEFSVFEEEYLVISTTTIDNSGSLLIVTSDNQGQLLQIEDGASSQSQTTLFAFYDSEEFSGDLPLFLHSTFASGTAANPPNSFITSVTSSVSLSSTDPNNLICILHPYGGVNDAQPYGECIQETSIAGAVIGLDENPYMRRVRAADRYYLANPLDFGHEDTMVVVLDNDLVNKSFTIPFYRNALTNTNVVSNPFNFDAYDIDSAPMAQFSTAFGSFDFSNFKVLMQAKKVLKHTAPQTALLYRSTLWGRSGEKITVGYVYPNAANAAIGSTVQVDTEVAVRISLASGLPSSTSIDASTEWNVTITPNTPVAGIDQVTYTWNTVGTNPGLSLSGGEYVNISSQSGFDSANTGVFRVSTEVGFTPTATAFSVQRPTGVAVVESNVPTTVNGSIIFYNATPTTALQIRDYVNANLALYLSATIVNDGGTSGSGVILLSTYEDSGFTYDSVQLLDGINWIATSNLGGSPQFVFKNPLALPTDVGYAFNDGETVRLIPTTIAQVEHFISILAVSGFTTLGTTKLVERAARLELATNVLGSSGAIQIAGGLANEFTVPVLDVAANIDNSFMEVPANMVASNGVHSDQWFRLQALSPQAKIAGFSTNTGVGVVGSTPIIGQATITLTGRTLTQRYFGKPRHNVRSRGNTFRVEKQGYLTCVSWTGAGTNPVFFKSVLNFNDSGGGTVDVEKVVGTNDATYTILTGNANFTELSIGDLLTVSGFTAPENNGTFLVTGVSDDGLIARVINSAAVDELAHAFVAGDFLSGSGVSEGDTVIFEAPFNVLNRGRYRVIRQYNNSVWIENPDTVEEEVSLPYNAIDLGFDATTEFDVDASNNTLFLQWTGIGTEPSLGNTIMGDVLTAGSDFVSANQGDFMVLRSSVKLPQITKLVVPSGPQFTIGGPGTYFLTYNAGDANQYYVWYNINGGNTDPAVVGFTGVMVAILSGDTAEQVATKTAAAINIGTVGITAVASSNTVTMTTTGFIDTSDTTNNDVPAPFSAQTLQNGTRTFLEAINPAAVNQASILITGGVLQAHRPQMQFWEYEASAPGDLFVATGNILTTPNAGSHAIFQVLNRDSAIVTASMATVGPVALNANTSAVFIEEGVPYSGYKQVFLVAAEPSAPTRNVLVFNTYLQYEKISQAAGVALTSLNKMNFNTAFLNGLDSYKYNTGLIAEANRIVYGDTRDPITYPGVGAAGADIFIKAPLALRVQVALDIRLLTGAPFNIVAQQVRTNVAYLINSNPVGQSIDISSIVSTVRSIPGVVSVAVSSPLYSPTEDLIQVAPSEKALIIDPTVDIQVSQIGV